MKKSLPMLFCSGLLILGTAACDGAQTSVKAPDSAQEKIPEVSTENIQENREDAQSKIRKDQLESDIRAREQRNDLSNDGKAQDRNDSDLASEVRSKLEANLPGSALVVESNEGVVIVKGTVTNEASLDDIQRLAKEIKGVQSVVVNAKIASAVQ